MPLSVNADLPGAFDPTVAHLSTSRGFGYRKTGLSPQRQAIDGIMPLVGFVACAIDSCGHIRKKSPQTEFNFSAITKGYGWLTFVGEMLRRNGCTDYMVEIGGEIALAGKNPRGDKWHIMVVRPGWRKR